MKEDPATYIQQVEKLAQALEAYAWDGEWYLRAFYDDGSKMGSHENSECQIDSIAQSWAVVPSQPEIDLLGGGKSVKDWERRFDLAYEKCNGMNVTLVGGVCPTAIRFGKYIHEKYKVYPKDIWKTQHYNIGE